MRTKLLSYSVPILICYLILAQNSFAQNKTSRDTLEVLQKKVMELELKTKLQQEKINELEGMIDQLNKKKPFAVFPREPKLNKRPNNAFPFEFNGNTYYFVPLIGKYINDIETLESTKRETK